MSLGRFLGGAALVMGAATAGWLLNGQFPGRSELAAAGSGTGSGPQAEGPPQSEAETTPGLTVFGYPRVATASSEPSTPEAAPAGKPVITLFSDGTVTIEVQKRPWRWVLEEVARQENARKQVPASPTPGARPDSRPAAAAASDPQEILQVIRNGDEGSRYQALLNARSTGTVVPEDTLKQLVEIDASERVRMLAFENYLERKSGSAEEVRAALEGALNIPSPAIQAEARKLLEQLSEQERSRADDPQAQLAGS